MKREALNYFDNETPPAKFRKMAAAKPTKRQKRLQQEDDDISPTRQKRQQQDDEDDDEPNRNAANERERLRMRVLSKAFVSLKTALPWVPKDTKLSKLDTLKLACCYIKHLKVLLDDDKPPPMNFQKQPVRHLTSNATISPTILQITNSICHSTRLGVTNLMPYRIIGHFKRSPGPLRPCPTRYDRT